MTWDKTALRVLPRKIWIFFMAVGPLVKLFFLRRNVRSFVSLVVLAQILVLWANYLGLNIKVIMLWDIIVIQLWDAWALDEVSFGRWCVLLFTLLNLIIDSVFSARNMIKHIDVRLLNFERSSVVQLLIGFHPRRRWDLQLNVERVIPDVLVLFYSLCLGLMKLDYFLLILVQVVKRLRTIYVLLSLR